MFSSELPAVALSVRHLRRLLWLALACVLVGCSSVFLHPDQVHYLADRELGTAVEDVWMEAEDGSVLHALYLPVTEARRGTVLFLHGNAENLSSHIHAVSWLPAQGYAVLALDYRGYGRSQGGASVGALHQDAATALAWLSARGAAQTGPLIVYGQSLGGSVAIRLIADHPPQTDVVAVIADSAFASYRGIAREKLGQVWLTWPLQWPLSWLISDQYAALDVVQRIAPIPLLLIHGEQDPVVPAAHSHRLFAAAADPKDLWLVPQGQHIDAVRRRALRERLLGYLAEVTAAAIADP